MKTQSTTATYCGSTLSDKSTIGVHQDKLNEEIARLEKIVESLEIKLAPVLLSCVGCSEMDEPNKCPEALKSGLSQYLNDLEKRVGRTNEKLERLIESCEL
jgi:hypothetical protein